MWKSKMQIRSVEFRFRVQSLVWGLQVMERAVGVGEGLDVGVEE